MSARGGLDELAESVTFETADQALRRVIVFEPFADAVDLLSARGAGEVKSSQQHANHLR